MCDNAYDSTYDNWVTIVHHKADTWCSSKGWALVNECGTISSGHKTKRDAITYATNVCGYVVVK